MERPDSRPSGPRTTASPTASSSWPPNSFAAPASQPPSPCRELQAGPVAGLRAFLSRWRETVVDTAFRAVSIEEQPTDETPAAPTAAGVFSKWESLPALTLGACRETG